LLGQTLPRTVRVATIGHVGTPRSLTVAVEGGWRLIDLGDHHLVGEGAGPAEWRFRIGSGGRVSVEGDRETHLLSSQVAGTPAPQSRTAGGDAAGFRLEGVVPEQRFTVSVGRGSLVYPGAVELWPAGHGAAGLRLINEAPIEQYLLGVVTAEGSASFQLEALKALAVAARSYAVHNRARHQPEAELCDTVHCQVYPGVGRVREKVARAVADTAGIVGLYGGAVIDAVFSADCGGRTRNSEDVWPGWGKVPYLRSVEDRPPDSGPDYCAVSRNHVYRTKLTPVQVGRLLGLRDLPPGKMTLAQVERDNSGSVAALQLSLPGILGGAGGRSATDRPLARFPNTPGGVAEEGDEPLPCELLEGRQVAAAAGPAAAAATGGRRSITFSQLRRSYGDQLRGRWVDTVLSSDGCLELECRGLGHGGAQGMALPPYNHTFDEILRHYYSGISLGPVPVPMGRLSLQLRGDGGQPLGGVAMKLLPGGLAGTTDGQGCWQAAVPEGTYSVEARQGAAAITFYAVRAAAGKSPETRLALAWRERDDRLAQARTGAAGR
jgi:SpoIID/LytB domain protein